MQNRPDAEKIKQSNELRIETVLALKKEFGKRFVGGIIPSHLIDTTYPEARSLITQQNTSQSAYFKLVTSCLVNVFTTGMEGSIGWRLPELMSASRCIVSEPLCYDLPEPLVDGSNCLFFGSVSECVEACAKILDDDKLSQRLRIGAYEYFMRNVKASELVMNTLLIATRTV